MARREARRKRRKLLARRDSQSQFQQWARAYTIDGLVDIEKDHKYNLQDMNYETRQAQITMKLFR